VEAARATGIVKHFESTTALDEVELTLAAGDVRGLLGPNGAGKTTLLQIMLGLLRPDAGEVTLLGHRQDWRGTSALSGVGGFVEEPSFYGYLSARRNLELLARLDGGFAGAAEIGDALARVDLAGRADDRVGGYSTGLRQRLGIAAALLRRPRLLLLDEPTSGLDPAGVGDVATLVRELADDGVAVLVSSHQIGELERICTGYTVLRAGRVVWDGSAAELEDQAPVSAHALHTTDDLAALSVAEAEPGVRARLAERGGLTVVADQAALDRLALALGDRRIAVRRLEQRVSPLESMFFALTGMNPVDSLGSDEHAERMLATA
jgi:ABC-2 type transport system ATP-binding protein